MRVHELCKTTCNVCACGGGDVRRNFCVEGDEGGVEGEDGGVRIVEERVDVHVRLRGCGEREEYSRADGEVQRSEDARAEGLVGRDDSVKVAAQCVSTSKFR